MAEVYKAPGALQLLLLPRMSHRPEIRSADRDDGASAIILETVASLNAVYPLTNRLIEISRDGQISEDESPDFSNIQENLEKVSLAIEALQLWVEKECKKLTPKSQLFLSERSESSA